jgi:hypothetical protein
LIPGGADALRVGDGIGHGVARLKPTSLRTCASMRCGEISANDALDLRLCPVAGRRRQHACRQQRCRRPVNIRTMPLSPENC